MKRAARLNILALVLVLGLLWPASSPPQAARAGEGEPSAPGVVQLSPPRWVGGAQGYKDQRDADIYPAVAYSQRFRGYLAVWLSPRNASSSGSGLDVYGVFLNRGGTPAGAEFRISDFNSVARSDRPVVVVNSSGEFLVAWTVRGCQIAYQRVNSTYNRPDRILPVSSLNAHSPSLVYNPGRNRYVLAYADGDDYLSPTMMGAQTGDCGSNPASTSRIRLVEFSLQSNDAPLLGSVKDISSVNGGSFRPQIAYSPALGMYQVVWEDRRYAGQQPYRIDVFSQRLGSDLSPLGPNVALMVEGQYSNGDNSATWTPRPVVAAGPANFMAAWFTSLPAFQGANWRAVGRIIPPSGIPLASFTITDQSFFEDHSGAAPTGFLTLRYVDYAREFLFAMSSSLESAWGYFSMALVQRLDLTGGLLGLDGTLQSEPGVGYSVDFTNDDQIGVALAVHPYGQKGNMEALLLYGKHQPGAASMNFDIWSARLQIPATGVPPWYEVFLPLSRRWW